MYFCWATGKRIWLNLKKGRKCPFFLYFFKSIHFLVIIYYLIFMINYIDFIFVVLKHLQPLEI